ncbi:hypothetical protein MJH12_08730, partial [bacterium]|nr:hypothetical protein [bacterium]
MKLIITTLISLLIVQMTHAAGLYKTDFGDVQIYLEASNVYGYYDAKKSGAIFLTNTGNEKYVGYWIQSVSDKKCKTSKTGKNGKASRYWGNLVFNSHNNGDNFKGFWAYCNKVPKGKWNGKLKGKRKASDWTNVKKHTSSTSTYSSDFGDVQIKESGKIVFGYYDNKKKGAILLNNLGSNKYDGYWIQSKSDKKCSYSKEGRNGQFSPYWGKLHFISQNDGAKFKGYWSYCGKKATKKWNGTLKKSKAM